MPTIFETPTGALISENDYNFLSSSQKEQCKIYTAALPIEGVEKEENAFYYHPQKVADDTENDTELARFVKEEMRNGHVAYNAVAKEFPNFTSRDISLYISTVCGWEYSGTKEEKQIASTPVSEGWIEKSDAIEFAEWLEDNSYTPVYSRELDKKAWVSSSANDIMLHGSDFHYTNLVKKHGKTLNELYELFISQLKIKL